ncbi:FadR family transcriptional regulator [Paenibacillus sp. SYP-B3998]|uniref:FadR family transcriptional regulator n=1 Tax=Paenibacillus sp. SYP-B3998 TaxID=2678564 RepID=A0A6G4A5I7_9BACL|nr:FadR/GntR family transcriptional regulator [Paenibacillus sp. SYP-B3998]NEW09069.1 FadR family transcriptional regulator [Paenibacillus sp. SYP-B3998]
MEVTKLMKRNHYEEITEQIKNLILQGQLKVGDKLPSTKELSERFGVGRSTTREALSALKAMGFIDIRQGGGCRIISNTPNEIELPELESLRVNRTTLLELLEARHSLEISNAAIAAEKRTDDDLEILNGLMKEMEASIGNDLEGERTDLLFHVSLAKATHNSIMVRLFDSIMNPMEMAIRETRRVEMYANCFVAERLYQEHSMIFEAVSARDKNLAARHMRLHLEHVESILTKYV